MFVEHVFVQPKTKGGYAMYAFSTNAGHQMSAWRNSQARRTRDHATRVSTIPAHSFGPVFRSAATGFVFNNQTDRKEVTSHE
jgi:hypothetical protein